MKAFAAFLTVGVRLLGTLSACAQAAREVPAPPKIVYAAPANQVYP